MATTYKEMIQMLELDDDVVLPSGILSFLAGMSAGVRGLHFVLNIDINEQTDFEAWEEARSLVAEEAERRCPNAEAEGNGNAIYFN